MDKDKWLASKLGVARANQVRDDLASLAGVIIAISTVAAEGEGANIKMAIGAMGRLLKIEPGMNKILDRFKEDLTYAEAPAVVKEFFRFCEQMLDTPE